MELFPQDKWLVQGVLGHQQKGNEGLFANEATRGFADGVSLRTCRSATEASPTEPK